MPNPTSPWLRRVAGSSIALFLGLAAALVWADDDDDDDRRRRTVMPAEVREECGACHVAYPARLLPVRSWRRIMAGLDNHYGADASLDADQVARITEYLSIHARGDRRGDPPPEDRITRSSWFVHEHDEIAAATWRDPSVRSAANCAACHTDAARGVFDERGIVMPGETAGRRRRD
ncbi:MAG: diheme cytochrome c [Burkholderiaceae bacterium]